MSHNAKDDVFGNSLQIFDRCADDANFADEIEKIRNCFYRYDKRILQNRKGIDLNRDNGVLEDGVFDTNIKDTTFHFLFVKARSKSLLVTYSGARTKEDLKNYTDSYQRWSYYSLLNSNLLSIADPTYLINDEVLLSWYYGTADRSYLIDSLQIVNYVSKQRRVENRDITFFSSSGGGYACMYASALLPGSLSIAINPQLFLEKWAYFEKFCNLCNVDPQQSDKFNRFNLLEHIKKHNQSCHLILINIKSNRDFKRQAIPFAKELNMNLRYGLNRYKNVLIWLFDCIGESCAHNSFETRPIFMGIYYIAKKFQQGFGGDDTYVPVDMQNLSLFINEIWHDHYDQKKALTNLLSLNDLLKQKYDIKNSALQKIVSERSANILFVDNEDLLERGSLEHEEHNIVIKQSDNAYNCYKYQHFCNRSLYKIKIEGITSATNTPKITVGLYNFHLQKIVKFDDYDIGDTIVFGFITDTNAQDIGLCIYAGIAGKTGENSISIGRLAIYKTSL